MSRLCASQPSSFLFSQKEKMRNHTSQTYQIQGITSVIACRRFYKVPLRPTRVIQVKTELLPPHYPGISPHTCSCFLHSQRKFDDFRLRRVCVIIMQPVGWSPSSSTFHQSRAWGRAPPKHRAQGLELFGAMRRQFTSKTLKCAFDQTM